MKIIFMYFIPTSVAFSDAQLALSAPLLELLQSSHDIRDHFHTHIKHKAKLSLFSF